MLVKVAIFVSDKFMPLPFIKTSESILVDWKLDAIIYLHWALLELSHVCSVAVIVHPPPLSGYGMYLSIMENIVRQGIICLLAVKNEPGVAT